MKKKPTSLVLGGLLLAAFGLAAAETSSAEFTSQSDTEVSVSSAPDWTPPLVSLNNPGTPVSGMVALSATASDADSSIASVTIQRRPAGSGSWTNLCTLNATPYTCSWNTTVLADGSYELRAIAVDAHTNSATSAVVTTQTANTPSVVLNPIPSPVRGTVTFSATFVNPPPASVSIRMQAYVTFLGWVDIPGCGAATGTTRTCTYDTSDFLDGTYDVRAHAVVSGTNYYDVQTDVVVDNTAPSTALTVPAGPLTGSVDLTATASDAGSGVESVAFMYRPAAGSWSTCAVDQNAPYACALTTGALPEGNYDFLAIGTDGAGNTTTTATQTRRVDHAAPTVSLTVPTGQLSGNVGLSATAADSMGIASVAFQYRASGAGSWSSCGTDNGAPYTCNLATGGIADATYEFQAVATDTSGRTTASAPLQSRMVDNNNPTVTVSPPANYLHGNVTVSATAADGNGITQVVLQYRQGAGAWNTCATDTNAPFECVVNTTPMASGNVEFRATATDGAGKSTTSTSQTRIVDNNAPAVSVTVPNGTLSDSVNIAATATDTHSGIASVQIQYRATGSAGAWTSCGTGTSCAVDTTSLDDGSYDFRAVATDNVGLSTTSAVVTRTVANTLFAADIRAVNGNNPGTPANTDQLVFTYNRQVDPASIKAGWNGLAGTSVNVTINSQAISGGPVGGRDWASFNVNLGAVAFTQNYLSGSTQRTFNNSTMSHSTTTVGGVTRSVVTVTFANGSGTFTDDNANGNMTWAPSTSVTSATGSATPCSATARLETDNDPDL